MTLPSLDDDFAEAVAALLPQDELAKLEADMNRAYAEGRDASAEADRYLAILAGVEARISAPPRLIS